MISGGWGYLRARVAEHGAGAELFTLFWPQSDQGFAHLRRLQTLTKIKFYFEFLSHIAISSLGILTK